MEELPGEADLHKFLKSKHLILVRMRSPFGYVYRVVHQPPKLPIHSELGTIQISKSESEKTDELAGLIKKKVETLIEPFKDDL